VTSLLASPAALAQDRAEDAVARFRVLDRIDPCSASRPDDEIVVCGNRRDRDRYRLPQLGRTNALFGAGNMRGEVPRPSADPIATGGCGIFQDQHRCSKAEMADAGYGGGRNPLTFITNLAVRLVDPDAETGSPPLIPVPPPR